MHVTRRCALVLSLLLAPAATFAATTLQDEVGRRALDHDDYDAWSSVTGESLSEDGRWLEYTLRPAEGASTLMLREVATRKQYTIPNGSGARFTHDGRHAIYLVQPDPEVLEKLEESGDKKAPRPRPKLEILELDSGRRTTIDDVRSFRLPAEASEWMTYSPSDAGDGDELRSGKATLEETYAVGAGGLSPVTPEEPKPKKSKDGGPSKDADDDKEPGDVLVLRDLRTGIERRYPDVTSHTFSERGARLAYAASAKDAEGDGVFVVELATYARTQVLSGRGRYSQLRFDEDESRLAFLSDRDAYGPVKPDQAVYLWTAGQAEARKIVDASTEGVPEGWWIASSGPSFTKDGRRLVLRTQPRPDDAGKTKKELEREKKAREKDPTVRLDVWHWKDSKLQPQQLLEAARERNRSYTAVYDLETRSLLQLATRDMPNVRLDLESTSDIAVGTSSLEYDVSNSWESPGFSDSYLIDLATGESTRILERVRGTASLSPEGRYVTWWDPDQLRWFAMSTADRSIVDLTGDLPVSFANELHDTPAPPRSYRSAGWLADDAAFLVYDRYDIWRVDPSGAEPAACLTGERGRADAVRYRYVRLDPEERAIDLSAPLLLSVFEESTKSSGYARLDAASGEITSELLLPERVDSLRKAEGADTVVLRRQTFRRYPDLWTTTLDFDRLTRITEANPQQRDFLWGTAELVHYSTTGGEPLEGILYKPDNFDPTRKYPMMVYFYERNADRLHQYHTPAAGRASINYSFYVSRGYVLFVPDIPYTTGHPGRSAADAVLPGVQSIVDRGFVDPARIGVQGHSWGGYQIAYLVTMTNVFACAEAGAPVSNMTSAYGGIRWGSGLSRMFQYEKTQSRIGDTLWNARDLYLENSPVFFADKVETPLLMLHNDEDGAVPWYQGIEMFVALRRLGKPTWMLNYNGEAHGLTRDENRRDFAIRMQQFFDHYLMDAPATRWIAEGVPAVDKGKDLGLEVIGAGEEASPAPAEEEGGEAETGERE